MAEWAAWGRGEKAQAMCSPEDLHGPQRVEANTEGPIVLHQVHVCPAQGCVVTIKRNMRNSGPA